MNIAVIVLAVVSCALGAHLPQSFKKCNRKDTDAGKCYLEAARSTLKQLTRGFPEVNLPGFEPLEITEWKIGSGQQGVVNVEQNFKNCKLYGISDGKIEDFGFNFDEKYLFGKGVIPVLKKACDYELNGKILVLPIVGTGKSTIILKNVYITLRFDYEEVKKKGKTYMNFNKQNLTADPESVSYNFENLFNGDKALGDNVNKVLNDNDKAVFDDVKKGYEDGIGLIVLQVVHNLFNKVSMEEAFD